MGGGASDLGHGPRSGRWKRAGAIGGLIAAVLLAVTLVRLSSLPAADSPGRIVAADLQARYTTAMAANYAGILASVALIPLVASLRVLPLADPPRDDSAATIAAARGLEIGPGTGHALAALARSAGPSGTVTGMYLSAAMLGRTGRQVSRLGQAGDTAQMGLIQGDAHRLPLASGAFDAFDAVFMSFVLELIGTRQIPQVLDECRHVLRPGGRLGVVSLQLTQPPPVMTQLYLAARRHLPGLLDCRTIPLSDLFTGTGWHLQACQPLTLAGLPATAAVATPASPSALPGS